MRREMDPADQVARAADWLQAQGWQPLPLQRRCWRAIAAGCSGLLHAGTGAGKTYAVWLGLLARHAAASPPAAHGLRLLWITPLRALAADTAAALQAPLATLAPGWRLGVRTGDTAASERARQRRRWPQALVITPENLCLLLAHAEAPQWLGQVQAVVVDEWHELLGSKRGVQVQLALARLRRWQPALQVWGLSATLANLDEALAALVGPAHAHRAVLVQESQPRAVQIDTLLPPQVERLAWAGHLGAAMAAAVAAELDDCRSALVFTNTRAQTEWWYQTLLELRPHWAGTVALHHGSLDAQVRRWVEDGLKRGVLRVVVCTSSLDLGVDFGPVERVLQIGSPKGVARLLQRAGRSGHGPGRTPRLTLVPTHVLELVEAAAARAAVQAHRIEPRRPPLAPLDVLVQHLVTVALGGGFRPDELWEEVRTTHAYATLQEASWRWCLDFVRCGGASLQAYPDYHRVRPDEQGIWRVPDARLARRHRLNIGTIVADAQLEVRLRRGGRLGSVEEGFIARLRPGQAFWLGGRALELLRVHDGVAWVRDARPGAAVLPRWSGARMPLSTELAAAILQQLQQVAQGTATAPELKAAGALLELQARWSALPGPEVLVAELLQDREGCHLFLYPLAGRDVHLGLASWLAWQATQHMPCTLSLAVNDWGLELLSPTPLDWAQWLPQWLRPPPEPQLVQQLLASLNATELAQRRFRVIARVAGLVLQPLPGQPRRERALQASATLLWQVLQRYDPANLLLQQAREEALREELDVPALAATLQRLQRQRLALHRIEQPTPLGLALLVERLRERLSSETLSARLQRLVARLQRAAAAPSRRRRVPEAAR